MDLSLYRAFFASAEEAGLGGFVSPLEAKLRERLHAGSHGDLARWRAVVSALPDLPAARIDLDAGCVSADSDPPLEKERRECLGALLMALHPWRKGPFCLHGVQVDSEWRSDWKWDRLVHAISPLEGRTVLDVGCGNGYHCWRMAGRGARVVLGIDPTLLSVMQFLAVSRLLRVPGVAVLPLALEELPGDMTGFDTVFSMGVLYHRRSPMDHLLDLRRLLRPGGELVLETLVLDDAGEGVLVPAGRYARMRNVWFIPTPTALLTWLGRCGYAHARLVDLTVTTRDEQRSTDWMRFQSLRDWLDPDDPTRTLEGYPAPCRGTFIARAGS